MHRESVLSSIFKRISTKSQFLHILIFLSQIQPKSNQLLILQFVNSFMFLFQLTAANLLIYNVILFKVLLQFFSKCTFSLIFVQTFKESNPLEILLFNFGIKFIHAVFSVCAKNAVSVIVVTKDNQQKTVTNCFWPFPQNEDTRGTLSFPDHCSLTNCSIFLQLAPLKVFADINISGCPKMI